jgi:hypothetical protein
LDSANRSRGVDWHAYAPEEIDIRATRLALVEDASDAVDDCRFGIGSVEIDRRRA